MKSLVAAKLGLLAGSSSRSVFDVGIEKVLWV